MHESAEKVGKVDSEFWSSAHGRSSMSSSGPSTGF